MTFSGVNTDKEEINYKKTSAVFPGKNTSKKPIENLVKKTKAEINFIRLLGTSR